MNQADGRDSDMAMMASPFRISREVFVPQIENGSLHYFIREIVAASDTDSGWAVREVPETFPTATGPSAIHVNALMESIGIDCKRSSMA